MTNYDNRDYDNRNNRDDRRDDRRDNNRDSGNGRDDGKTQLFFAKGRNDGMTTEALLDFIVSRIPEIDETVVSSIKILDAFSFFAVPQEDAEIILDFFQEEAGEGRPLVSKAKRKTESRGDFGGRRDDRRDDRRGGGFGGGNGGGGYRNNDRGDRGNDRRDDRGGRRESSFGGNGNGNSFGGERKPRNY